MKNFENFYDNWDANDTKGVKAEVRDYVKVSKEYKKQLKDTNIEQKKRSSLEELLDYDTTKGNRSSPAKRNKKNPDTDLWQCQRVNDE